MSLNVVPQMQPSEDPVHFLRFQPSPEHTSTDKETEDTLLEMLYDSSELVQMRREVQRLRAETDPSMDVDGNSLWTIPNRRRVRNVDKSVAKGTLKATNVRFINFGVYNSGNKRTGKWKKRLGVTAIVTILGVLTFRMYKRRNKKVA
eukprot:g3246.t1